jgi:hypothetical protein
LFFFGLVRKYGWRLAVSYFDALHCAEGVLLVPGALVGDVRQDLLVDIQQRWMLEEMAKTSRFPGGKRSHDDHGNPPPKKRPNNGNVRPHSSGLPRPWVAAALSTGACINFLKGACTESSPHATMSKRTGQPGRQVHHACPNKTCPANSPHNYDSCPNKTNFQG